MKYVYLSIFVPLLIIHKSHRERAIRLNATNTNKPDSVEVHPGIIIFKSCTRFFRNLRSTCALATVSFFSEIKYCISSSAFLAFLLRQKLLLKNNNKTLPPRTTCLISRISFVFFWRLNTIMQ